MITPRQDAIKVIHEAVEECPCDDPEGCRLCRGLLDAIDLLDGGDVIPPDGWAVAGDMTVDAAAPPVVRLNSGGRLVTLRRMR